VQRAAGGGEEEAEAGGRGQQRAEAAAPGDQLAPRSRLRHERRAGALLQHKDAGSCHAPVSWLPSTSIFIPFSSASDCGGAATCAAC
jgi:hypothetical protein